ncbi:MAG: hypothetical protein LBI53_06950 [Candidatus Peribacteria bacterium]|jgi:hypothetical protein|nr:hypothetical protein [Candidatus Peribacteria bacterium]
MTKNWILTTVVDNLEERKDELINLAHKLFMDITALPKEVRNDEKERTGIAVFIAPRLCDNFIRFKIGTSSDRAIWYAQRKAKSLEKGDFLITRDFENPEHAIWAGGITTDGWVDETKNETNPERLWLYIGVSGLKAEEDEVVAIILAAAVLDVNSKKMVDHMIYGEISENIRTKGHYLYEVVKRYS